MGSRRLVRVPTVGPFYAFVTAEHADSKPVLQWDRDDRRNQVSWYTRPTGSPATAWCLAPGWTRAVALSRFPHEWHGAQLTHQAGGVLFVIDGCKPSDLQHRGGGLFPESLRSDLHGIRRVVEAHAQTAAIAGADDASACGLAIRVGQRAGVTLRVTSAGTRVVYMIDRWD